MFSLEIMLYLYDDTTPAHSAQERVEWKFNRKVNKLVVKR